MSEVNHVEYHATGETIAIYVYVNGEQQKFVKESFFLTELEKKVKGKRFMGRKSNGEPLDDEDSFGAECYDRGLNDVLAMLEAMK